ncbi:formate dehydrogenase subunit gamma [Ramlibacter humi]|uniref:Formate dehydrogenase subunit gamma n=1 Tax=Ramlibacter humi TaxID=2530451 RepID=A0A4Z0BXI3_9BURK|nr:formate dehydrogenase subunit gamma [Ramlibacter humi]TFZ03963.1 formate dehydrogenase subunit gamma [Ramlibacter humi]
MSRSTELIARSLIALAALVAGPAMAQATQPGQSQGSGQAAAAQPAASQPTAAVGIQGQNIFQVKPETRPDASSEPGYAEQTNGQRNRVQPGNNAPMWRQVQNGMEGYSSLPKSEAPEAGVLIQAPVQYPGSRFTTAGEAWRQVRNRWLIPYGGSLILITLGALAIFYFAKGPVGQHDPDTGRKIERFTPFERAAHWANAIAFVALMITGIVMAFGKFFLLPILGGTLFGWLTWLLKTLHNFAGPLFAVSLVIVFFTFLRDNWPQKGDLHWLARAGGMLGKPGQEPPSHRFNAGEKIVFWGGVLFLGAIVVASGLVLDKLIPNLAYTRATMQVAHMVHAVATVLMMCLFLGHIYLGTIGMRGAYSAMRNGYVDEEWAREHHAYWYEDIRAGRIPAQRSTPREGGAPDQVRPA